MFGSCATFLRRKTATNGFESWGQLVVMYKIPLQPRAMRRRSKIMRPGPTRANFEGDLVDVF